MKEVVYLLIGMLAGSCFSVGILCCVQINRIGHYEWEIRKLRNKLKNKE